MRWSCVVALVLASAATGQTIVPSDHVRHSIPVREEARGHARQIARLHVPIEIVIVTHADYDHWNGVRRLLGFDGTRTPAQPSVLEFWERGYDRDSKKLASYDRFLNDMRGIIDINYLRPLREHHTPRVDTDEGAAFTRPSLPGVTFTLLHADADPPAATNCAYQINNASIVLRLDIHGHRFLLTGDANGKGIHDHHLRTRGGEAPQTTRRNASSHSPQCPAHYGSETASTQAFIDAVSPAFAVISSSTRHHLPKPTVVRRYEHPQRTILRTDMDSLPGVDHIVCYETVERTIDCNYRRVLYPE